MHKKKVDLKNSYKSYAPYLAYTKNTNEKAKLHEYLARECKNKKLPIQLQDKNKNILDLGCGNGTNTFFMAKLFSKNHIDAIDRSESQVVFAKKNNAAKNIEYGNFGLEDFKSQKKYDFILVSHVLQYIDSGLEEFIKKALLYLNDGGEIWFVQQTKKGMLEIIKHQIKFLTNPRFKNWKTYEDYLKLIKKIIKGDKQYVLSEGILNSSFKKINFSNPTEEDKKRLEFIFCLEGSFDEQSDKFKKHLEKLNIELIGGRISHPNKIIKIRKVK